MISLQRNTQEDVGAGGCRLVGMPLPAMAVLLLSAVVAVVRAQYQLLGMDEYGFGLLGLARNGSFAHLVRIQLTKPVSFDPIGYNALIYGVIHYFGTGMLTMRLPSIAGYLVMQVCLFWVVRRIANEWAATVAMALPALIGVVGYAIEARPYAVMLGCAAFAVVCWQTAARRTSGRTLALVGLAISLAAAVNMQYYAVLLFVPLCAAEAVRMMQMRRADVPMLGALAGGLAGLALVMPFARALSIFQENHTQAHVADVHFITHSYLWLVIGYNNPSLGQQHAIGLGCAGLLVALLGIFVWARERIALLLPLAELVLLVGMAAIPVFAYLLAIFVTHFIEARYILPAMIGIAAVIGILLAPLLQHRVVGLTVMVLLLVAIAGAGVERVRLDRKNAQEYMASMEMSPETLRALEADPGEPIYVTNHFVFEFLHYYSPSAEIRSRLTLVYLDPDHFGGGGVGADVNQQMANMEADGVPLVTSYESLDKPGTEHLFLLYHSPWEWMDSKLAEAGAGLTPLGHLFKGDLTMVRFR